eukprot:CAMPEP_0173460324 /NCGR_PEP_ID=MMETSP1357-20121228/62937_1 /TAXON_ID=77926 /ORGANISM="Hemiselmis rufescens, Strain PCC563" /LENGTH=41 /DNA_ID= /DNA_START= /DNA_END= /DNA_ORIENTATION=
MGLRNAEQYEWQQNYTDYVKVSLEGNTPAVSERGHWMQTPV